MDQDTAQTIALRAAAWMASDVEMIEHFLASSGMSLLDFRQHLAQPEVLTALVDFICLEDAWVLECAKFCSVPPETLTTVRCALPGGAAPNWT